MIAFRLQELSIMFGIELIKCKKKIYYILYKMITKTEMKKIETHSKKHKGGMNSKHIKNMMKFMKKGDAFITAHKKAINLDKKSSQQQQKKNNSKMRYS